MPTVLLGNESVIERVKKDPGLDDSPDNVDVVTRKDLGNRVTTMGLNEVDGDDNPSRAMNLATAVRFWTGHSDKPPSWVESDDELLAQLIAGHFGCEVGRPRSWKEG